MIYKINKQKCIGCQVCLQACPGATKINEEGKAEIINQEKLAQCGGENVCPSGAIEKVDEKGRPETKIFSQPNFQSPSSYQSSPFGGRGFGQGRGFRQGQGMGAGRGRGMGRGPRDGRGGGWGRGFGQGGRGRGFGGSPRDGRGMGRK